MDNDLNLNTSAVLPDGGLGAPVDSKSMGGLPSSALKTGYETEGERTARYDTELTGENTVGDPATFGGVCGRPLGWAR